MQVFPLTREPFVEVLVGRTTYDDLRHLLGPVWPVGAHVYVGGGTSPLHSGDYWDPIPGMLISVCPADLVVVSRHTLQERMNWLAGLEDPAASPFPSTIRRDVQVSVLGPWTDSDTFPIAPDTSVGELQLQICQTCGLPESSTGFTHPSDRIPDLSIRGRLVSDVLAAVPGSMYVGIFLDARNLARHVCFLILPPAVTTITRVLGYAGVCIPTGRRILVAGAPRFDPVTETFIPIHGCVIGVRVACGESRSPADLLMMWSLWIPAPMNRMTSLTMAEVAPTRLMPRTG